MLTDVSPKNWSRESTMTSAMQIRILPLLISSALLVTGCGLKGELYLPSDEPAPEESTSVQPNSSTVTDSQDEADEEAD
jgi:predicted small lipoprotein YifL